MGSRRGFICRMKVGAVPPDTMATGHLNRNKQRNTLGPSKDGHNYAVVHCTGFIKNWPPNGQFDNPLNGIVSMLLYSFSSIFLLNPTNLKSASSIESLIIVKEQGHSLT